MKRMIDTAKLYDCLNVICNHEHHYEYNGVRRCVCAHITAIVQAECYGGALVATTNTGSIVNKIYGELGGPNDAV